jgi:uncharacterized protein (TIGR03435 family)
MPIRRLPTFFIAFSLCAQQSLPAQFEVASIHPSNPNELHAASGIKTGKSRLSAHNVTLKRCLMGAYAIGPNQIFGGPPWLDSDRFEIEAKTNRPTDDDAAFMSMLQTLLADRFKLVLHRETRSIPAYVVKVARGGPKLEPAPDGDSKTDSGHGRIDAQVITIRRFAEVLSRQLDLPVVDQTGLGGAFNLKLEWNPDVNRPEAGPSLLTAIQQLGLHLQSAKAPVEVIVLDRAEKPTAN